MIEYECEKDNCYFDIDKEDVKKSKVDGKYIACPICGSRNIKKREDIESIMQERSAVEQ